MIEQHAFTLWNMAEWLESGGNIGVYRATLIRLFGVTPSHIPKRARDGIIFYSRGHGWRVRKDPHWKDVFRERFPMTYEKIMRAV